MTKGFERHNWSEEWYTHSHLRLMYCFGQFNISQINTITDKNTDASSHRTSVAAPVNKWYDILVSLLPCGEHFSQKHIFTFDLFRIKTWIFCMTLPHFDVREKKHPDRSKNMNNGCRPLSRGMHLLLHFHPQVLLTQLIQSTELSQWDKTLGKSPSQTATHCVA